MTVQRALFPIAGGFILLSLALGVWVHQNWLWFTAFVGANLFQAGLTKWCPMMTILRWFGLRDEWRACKDPRSA